MKSTEEMIQEKGLEAPRLTPDMVQGVIDKEQYHIFEGSQLTICCLTLKNGFTVTGESACVSPENFDRDIGRKVAYENAVHKIWALEGYLLKEQIHNNVARLR
jgi:hypothetical protein